MQYALGYSSFVPHEHGIVQSAEYKMSNNMPKAQAFVEGKNGQRRSRKGAGSDMAQEAVSLSYW